MFGNDFEVVTISNQQSLALPGGGGGSGGVGGVLSASFCRKFLDVHKNPAGPHAGGKSGVT